MADGCYYEEDADSIQRIFTQNFLDHYTGDKTPFPLFFHSAWFFNRPHRQEGFFKFVDSILALPDVYFVTVSDYLLAIYWSRHPACRRHWKLSQCRMPTALGRRHYTALKMKFLGD